MKKFELQTLVFNEDDKIRTFFSNDFNFILDKSKRYSICYGKTPNDTPTYDPLGPEEIDVIINDNFEFNKQLLQINKLLNIHQENDDSLISISTITNVNVVVKNLYMKNVDEVSHLIKYLNSFNFNVNLIVDYSFMVSFSEIFRLKVFNASNITFDVWDFNPDSLIETMENCLSKDLNVSFNFNINTKNYKNFINLLEFNRIPQTIFSNILFHRPITKKIKDEIVKKLDDSCNFTICDTKFVNNKKIKYNKLRPYQDGLFKCYINFNDGKVYSSADNQIGIDFYKIENINSYWNSEEFFKFRNNLIENKYEEN